MAQNYLTEDSRIKALENVKYSFIDITPRSIVIWCGNMY